MKVTGAPMVTKSCTVDGKTYTAKQGIYVHQGNLIDIADMTGGSICVSDIHESAFFADHTYSMKVIAGKDGAEEVVYSGEIDLLVPFYYGLDADNTCDYYRVEVYDESDTRITTGMPIAIGNPIWSIK